MEINVDEIEQELARMTPEEMKKVLLDAKVRQKVMTKKYYNPEKAKERRQKAAAVLSAQSELAKGMPATDGKSKNLYEQILAEANELADAKLAQEEAEATAA